MGLADEFQRARDVKMAAMPFVLDGAYAGDAGGALAHPLDPEGQDTLILTQTDLLRQQIEVLDRRGTDSDVVAALTDELERIVDYWGSTQGLSSAQPAISLLHGRVLIAATHLEGMNA